MGRRVYDTLDREESLRLLATVPVGRLVFTTAGLPAVEPVNFIVADGQVVFRTREGSKLIAVRDGTVVAFEADHLDSDSRTGWSVTVVGKARVLDEAAAQPYRDGYLRPWVNGGLDDVVAIDTTVVTGRRIRVDKAVTESR